MPKVRERLDDRKKKELQALIAYKRKLYDVTYEELAIKVRVHERTLRYQVNNPDLLRMKTLRLLFDTLHFSEEEKMSVM